MGRAPCCDKANVKKGPWSPEEDAALKDYIEKNGTGGNWIALPQKIGTHPKSPLLITEINIFLERSGKSSRLRWLNYLRPNIKHGGFTEEEDNIICGLYVSIGSREMNGSNDNSNLIWWSNDSDSKSASTSSWDSSTTPVLMLEGMFHDYELGYSFYSQRFNFNFLAMVICFLSHKMGK
ncbi:unnamed protein product [Lupinus luteus]|uniref:Uncharacterized protein n=1 Tax=Lupinus luteus TaxID=3873 RepID=A0AAV1YBL6_LUPLU